MDDGSRNVKSEGNQDLANPDTCYLIKKDNKCPDCGESMPCHNWWCRRTKHFNFGYGAEYEL